MTKKHSRRTFIELGLSTGIGIPLLASGLIGCNSNKQPVEDTSTIKPLKILILGGTSFLGPHQIAYALGRGHTISTFTRGKTKPTIHTELFNDVEQLIGDRNDDLSALENRKWDAVIDNSGHRAEWTKNSAALLKENCGLYFYTSSTGVYYPYLTRGVKEDANLVLSVPTDATGESKMEYDYGVMKANSEIEAINEFGIDRTIIVRPTYMIGPADKTNRFIHWPIRLSKGGEILIPGKISDPVQYIDVRDVASWMIRLIEARNTGTFNAVGPAKSQHMPSFVKNASTNFNISSSFVQIDDYDFLKENNVHYIIPWIMPVGNNTHSANISKLKCMSNGLTIRPLNDSIQDIYEWWNSAAVTQQQRDNVALDPKSILMREREIIKKWKSR